jgi:ferredoxin-thioredoxin reductase catalytic subunit
MKLFISGPCSHNQHELCNEKECMCGCHFPKRNHKEGSIEETIRRARKEEMKVFDHSSDKLRAIAEEVQQ